MRNPIQAGKTTFVMSKAGGEWYGKWKIRNSWTGRTHLILDSEKDADAAMDGISAEVAAAEMAARLEGAK